MGNSKQPNDNNFKDFKIILETINKNQLSLGSLEIVDDKHIVIETKHKTVNEFKKALEKKIAINKINRSRIDTVFEILQKETSLNICKWEKNPNVKYKITSGIKSSLLDDHKIAIKKKWTKKKNEYKNNNKLTILHIDSSRIKEVYQEDRQLTSWRFFKEIDKVDFIKNGVFQLQKKEPVIKLPRVNGLDNREQEREQKIEKIYDEFIESLNLEENEKCIIVAEMGAGKTTMMQQIADEVFDGDLGIPIWISLKDLKNSSGIEQEDLLDNHICKKWLAKVLKKKSESITDSETIAFEEYCQKNKIWLLLDGLDEMEKTESQSCLSVIKEQIDNLSIKFDRVIISCRQTVWNTAIRNELNDFQAFYLQKFSEEQKKEFIDNWFKSTPDLATRLKEELKKTQHQNINDLVTNPLLLTMLCIVFQGKAVNSEIASFPTNRTVLFNNFYAYISQWKNEEFNIDDNEQKELGDIVAQIALENFQQGLSSNYIEGSVIEKVLKNKYKGNSQKIKPLSTILEQTWLPARGVEENDPSKKIHEFLHLSFQEYFAAKAIEDWDFFLPRNHTNKPIEDKEYRIFDPKYQEIILFWMGQEGYLTEKKEFLQKLINFEDSCDNYYSCKALLLAKKIVSEFDNLFIDLANYIEDKIIFLLKDNNFYVSSTLEKELPKINSTKDVIVNHSIHLLPDKNFDITKAVREKLPKISLTKDVIKNQIIPCLKDEDFHIRSNTIKLLGTINLIEDIITNYIIPLLKHKDTRRAAIEVLKRSKLSEPTIIKYIIPLLNDDKSFVRRYANALLIKSNLSTNIINSHIIPLLKSNNSPVRWYAIKLVIESNLSTNMRIKHITPLLEDEDERVSCAAIEELWKINSSEKFLKKHIIPLLESNDSDAFLFAIETLGFLLWKSKLSEGIIARIVSYIPINYNDHIYYHCQNAFGLRDSSGYEEIIYCFLERLSYQELYDVRNERISLSKVTHLSLDISSLQEETEDNNIAQYIINQIYDRYIEEYQTIPEPDRWVKLQKQLIEINKNIFKKDVIAISIEKTCKPTQELVKFLSKLTNKSIKIAWITHTLIKSKKIRTISPESTNIDSAINNWLQQLEDGMEA